MSRLTVYSREGCTLCDELLAELAPWADAQGAVVAVFDVDAEPLLQRRYGLRVPVLLVDGERVCEGHLDQRALERAWAGAG